MARKKKATNSGHGGVRPGAGRKRTFKETTVARALHLPPAFWAVLDELQGSRSAAFVRAIQDDELIARLRRALMAAPCVLFLALGAAGCSHDGESGDAAGLGATFGMSPAEVSETTGYSLIEYSDYRKHYAASSNARLIWSIDSDPSSRDQRLYSPGLRAWGYRCDGEYRFFDGKLYSVEFHFDVVPGEAEDLSGLVERDLRSNGYSIASSDRNREDSFERRTNKYASGASKATHWWWIYWDISSVSTNRLKIWHSELQKSAWQEIKRQGERGLFGD